MQVTKGFEQLAQHVETIIGKIPTSVPAEGILIGSRIYHLLL